LTDVIPSYSENKKDGLGLSGQSGHDAKRITKSPTHTTSAVPISANRSPTHSYMVICSTIGDGCFIGTFRAFTSFAGGSNFCSSDFRFWIVRSSFELLQDLLHCSTSYTEHVFKMALLAAYWQNEQFGSGLGKVKLH